MRRTVPAILLRIALLIGVGMVAIAETNSATKEWSAIAPFFQPPAPYSNQLGKFRSPLIFADGSPVQTAGDWPRRRAEIRQEWMDLMGPWPELLKKPRFEVLGETNQGTRKQRRVRVELAPGQFSEGWLLQPAGKGPFPAVVVVYYEPETSVGLNPAQTHRDFGRQLAQRGFVTLSLGTPAGTAWKPETGDAQCQPLSYDAYIAANAWNFLSELAEVDRTRIGITGHSYGGKWALFAAALWDRYAAVAVSDPGVVFDESRANVNYWEPWYLGRDPQNPRPTAGIPSPENPRTGAYREMRARGRDLHELHALIAPRPFLVSGGAEDPPERWIALHHLVAINRLLGFTHRVALTQREGHAPTPESNAQLQAFFVHFLRP